MICWTRLPAGLALLCGIVAAQPRLALLEDLMALRTVSGVVASPSSAAVLYQVSTRDFLQNRTKTVWMEVGSEAPVTAIPDDAESLRWSPDGRRLAFFAAKDGAQGLWTLDWAAKRLTRVSEYGKSSAYLAHSGNRLAWSPDGQRIAFAGTLEPAPAAGDPAVITRILYKNRTGFSDGRRTHIYVVPAAGGDPALLTPGDHDEHSLDWSAGPEIVFLSNRGPDPDAVLNYDIYAVNPDNKEVRQITKTEGVEMGPVISGDGKRVAYTATTRKITTIDSIAEDTHVWVIPLRGGEARKLHPELDRRSMSPQWDGDSVVYRVMDEGRVTVYRDRVPLLHAEANVSEAARHRDAWYYLQTDALRPRELWKLAGGAPQPVTQLNRELLEQFQIAQPEKLRFQSFDGTRVESLLYTPVGPPPDGRKWPLILNVHGGPHGMWGYTFSILAQAAVARGYAMLLPNPRGSTGYGQAFADGTLNAWGRGDYRDLIGAVDDALARYPQIDEARMFVMGGSYGGYMTNWIISQTGRFRAAASYAGLSNLISFYATSLYQDLIHAEFGGYPWDPGMFETLWELSPLRHVAKVSTPTLFAHGESDNDVHITQSEEMFTALRQRGIEAALVRYPGQGHGATEPRQELDLHRRTLDWFDRH